MTISFDVLLADPFPPGVDQVACQGEITAANAPALPTDDPDTPTPPRPHADPGRGGGRTAPEDRRHPHPGRGGLIALILVLGGCGVIALGRARPRLAGLGADLAAEEIRRENEAARRSGRRPGRHWEEP